MPDEPYTRAELLAAGDDFPDRGPLCQKCHTNIPQFAELSESDERRTRQLIDEDRRIQAISELRVVTGCSLKWAKLWVHHEGRPEHPEKPTAPCPYCGMPLRTSLAKQCRHCLRDWHDPDKVIHLGDSPQLFHNTF